MKFKFKAVKDNGEIINDIIDMPNKRSVLTYLDSKKLKPIVIKKISGKEINIKFFQKRMNLEDIVFITKYLALMLKVGTDLFKAIDILIQDFDKEAVRKFLFDVRKNLENGKPFYLAFKEYPETFSPVFINLVKSGEMSGNLQGVFEQLSEEMEKQHELLQKIKSALTYPIILMIGSMLVLILIVSYSLPKVAQTFMSGGMHPPGFSKIVFTIGLYVGAHLKVVLSVFVISIISPILFFSKTTIGKKILYDIALKIPVIRTLIKKISLQAFASTLASLLKSGMSITEALEITAGSVGIPEMRSALLRISNEGIKKGLTVGEAFKKETAFPKVVSNLISVSEKSGNLEEILYTLGSFYSGEIESSLKSLVSFIEPVMLLFIGLIIGIIALAVIIPVYQLSASL